MKDKAKEILDRHLEEGIVCCSRENGYIDGSGNDGKRDSSPREGIYKIIETAMLEFARLACESQKKECFKISDNQTANETLVQRNKIFNCKNVCDL